MKINFVIALLTISIGLKVYCIASTESSPKIDKDQIWFDANCQATKNYYLTKISNLQTYMMSPKVIKQAKEPGVCQLLAADNPSLIINGVK